jgi:HD-GYP domain-containing protein (c-di-GMP phosphodiesterase class II)
MEELPSISWGYALQKEQDDTLDLLEEQAEVFMYNRKFYSHQSMRSKTVNTIMETLFTKSEREKNHSERVGLLSESIAKHMHLSNEEIDKISFADSCMLLGYRIDEVF